MARAQGRRGLHIPVHHPLFLRRKESKTYRLAKQNFKKFRESIDARAIIVKKIPKTLEISIHLNDEGINKKSQFI